MENILILILISSSVTITLTRKLMHENIQREIVHIIILIIMCIDIIFLITNGFLHISMFLILILYIFLCLLKLFNIRNIRKKSPKETDDK